MAVAAEIVGHMTAVCPQAVWVATIHLLDVQIFFYVPVGDSGFMPASFDYLYFDKRKKTAEEFLAEQEAGWLKIVNRMISGGYPELLKTAYRDPELDSALHFQQEMKRNGKNITAVSRDRGHWTEVGVLPAL